MARIFKSEMTGMNGISGGGISGSPSGSTQDVGKEVQEAIDKNTEESMPEIIEEVVKKSLSSKTSELSGELTNTNDNSAVEWDMFIEGQHQLKKQQDESDPRPEKFKVITATRNVFATASRAWSSDKRSNIDKIKSLLKFADTFEQDERAAINRDFGGFVAERTDTDLLNWHGIDPYAADYYGIFRQGFGSKYFDVYSHDRGKTESFDLVYDKMVKHLFGSIKDQESEDTGGNKLQDWLISEKDRGNKVGQERYEGAWRRWAKLSAMEVLKTRSGASRIEAEIGTEPKERGESGNTIDPSDEEDTSSKEIIEQIQDFIQYLQQKYPLIVQWQESGTGTFGDYLVESGYKGTDQIAQESQAALVALLHISGLSNIEIAEKIGKSSGIVSKMLGQTLNRMLLEFAQKMGYTEIRDYADRMMVTSAIIRRYFAGR